MIFNKLFGNDKEPTAARKRTGSRSADKNRTQITRKRHQKFAVEDLRVGMFVVELDIPWEESTFMLQGLEITTTQDILELQKQCKFVYVDFDEFSLKKDTPAQGLPGAPKTEGLVSVQEEHGSAQQMHAMASNAVSTLFEEIRLGAEIDGGKVKQIVSGCVDSIVRNPDASVWLTRIQAKDEGTAQHSLNVSALSIVMGRSMGLSPRELEDVGVCAMLHDVGKTSIPEELLQKAGPLTAEETVLMHKHTRYGRDLLVSTKSVFAGAADVAHSHHERPDGKGYPRGLTDDSIPLYAKIVSIAEAYDSITTRQPYREAKSPSDALQELYANRGTQFDEELVIKFIDSIGIFPPGSIVEMVNGDIGIVLSNTSDKLRPRVIVILDSDKEAMPQRVIDLSLGAADKNGTMYQIKTTLPDGSFGINIEDFQRAGLRVG